jgi:hypothetical protein
MLLYLVIVLVFSLSIRIFAWEKGMALMKNTWKVIILIDIIGMVLLGLSILFARGAV